MTVGTYADVASTIAKGADAILFNGSAEAFKNQLTKTVINVGSGVLLNSLTAKVITRTGFKTGPAFRSVQSGQFVSNLRGFTVTAVSDATKITIGVGQNVWKR